MTRVGFIGLGTMGAPMARNLLAAGFPLSFFTRRPDVQQEFRDAGATCCASCAEVAQAADMVITIVTADAQVEEVVLGKDGVLQGASPGKLLIDMSTIGPETARRVASRLVNAGMSMLDAPVSGGPGGARDATLAIMVGGEEQDVARAQPVLEALGKTILHLGPLGAGQTAKLINQLMAGGTMALVGEGMAIARSAGLDLNQLASAVAASSGNSVVFAARHQSIIDDRFDPAFTSALMRKDIALAVELASKLGVETPVASASLDQYDRTLAAGNGDQDFAIVARAVSTKESS